MMKDAGTKLSHRDIPIRPVIPLPRPVNYQEALVFIGCAGIPDTLKESYPHIEIFTILLYTMTNDHIILFLYMVSTVIIIVHMEKFPCLSYTLNDEQVNKN